MMLVIIAEVLLIGVHETAYPDIKLVVLNLNPFYLKTNLLLFLASEALPFALVPIKKSGATAAFRFITERPVPYITPNTALCQV